MTPNNNLRPNSHFDILSTRDQRRFDESILNDVKINSIEDIKRIIGLLSNRLEYKEVETTYSLDNQQVKTKTKSRSPYQTIFDVLKSIKDNEELNNTEPVTIEVNGKVVEGIAVNKSNKAWNPVDQYIKRYAGAKRDGYLIVWDLGGYEYRYDIFAHKLTKSATSGDL